jgi:hypothetical protein
MPIGIMCTYVYEIRLQLFSLRVHEFYKYVVDTQFLGYVWLLEATESCNSGSIQCVLSTFEMIHILPKVGSDLKELLEPLEMLKDRASVLALGFQGGGRTSG